MKEKEEMQMSLALKNIIPIANLGILCRYYKKPASYPWCIIQVEWRAVWLVQECQPGPQWQEL